MGFVHFMARQGSVQVGTRQFPVFTAGFDEKVGKYFKVQKPKI